MSRHLIAFVTVLAACFGAQTLALRLAGGRTVKSESNYFSSIARLQTETRNKPRIMLLGSSMTGRLADRAADIPGVANLGCDGGSPVITLRAIDRGLLPAAPVIVVEANSLTFELEGRGREIAAAIDSGWFQLGGRFPNLGATARPTAFAYSWLMARRAGSAPVSSTEGLPISTKPELLSAAPALDPLAAALAEELAGILRRLEKRGSRVVIVMLPPGAETDAEENLARLANGMRRASSAPHHGMKILSHTDPGYAAFVRRLNRRALPEAGVRDLVAEIIARSPPRATTRWSRSPSASTTRRSPRSRSS
jgi:hypothetical protein